MSSCVVNCMQEIKDFAEFCELKFQARVLVNKMTATWGGYMYSMHSDQIEFLR